MLRRRAQGAGGIQARLFLRFSFFDSFARLIIHSEVTRVLVPSVEGVTR